MTFVTGYFGMNTGSLPFGGDGNPDGTTRATLLIAAVGIVTGLATWLISAAAAGLKSQRIASAASAGGILAQNAMSDQAVDVAQGGVGGTLGDFRPFSSGELAIEAVQQFVEHQALAVIQRDGGMVFPETELSP